MPIYFFRINDEPRSEGFEFEDVETAKREALRYAGRVICEEHIETFWDAAEWKMTVADSENVMLVQLVMIGTEAPIIQKPIFR